MQALLRFPTGHAGQTRFGDGRFMVDQIYYYVRYYIQSANHFWQMLGPYEYGAILLVIAAAGWLLMRSSAR